jgi:long-chain acyl-CoA synthetase
MKVMEGIDKTAIIYGEERIAYSELADMIRRYSTLFNCAKGERVAIFAENRPEWVYAFYASWSKGCVNVLIDMFSTDAEVSYILTDCAPSVILTSNRNIDTLKSSAALSKSTARIINMDEISLPDEPASFEDYHFNNDEIALLLYTSGTTGGSKGVMLSWENIHKNIRWNNDSKRININDTMLAVLPVHHSWPLMATILCPLECGATVVFLKTLGADELLRCMKEHQVTMLTAVPRLFELLHRGIRAKINRSLIAKILLFLTRAIDIMNLSKIVFGKVHREFGGHIKVLISGGAKLDNEIIRDFRGMGFLMLEGYGLTETAPMATYHPFDAQRIGSAGRVFDEIDIRFGDDDEIILRGPNVMKGYWNKPDETAEVLRHGWFYTGDLGRIDSQRYLYITGRKKDIIVLPNGKNIRPDLIEDEITSRFPLVREIAVTERSGLLYAIIRPDMERVREEKITNLVETVKWNIIDIYNQKAKSYNRINDFLITNEEFPRTRMGKLRRYMLASFIEKGPEKKAKENHPQFDEYDIIAKQIAYLTDAEIFPSDHIEIDLGMDSLSIIELQVFIEKTFGITIGEGWTGKFPTVRSLAEHVREAKTMSDHHTFDWGNVLHEKTDIVPNESGWMLRTFRLFFKYFYGRKVSIDLRSADRIPDGACVIAPNHQSFMDSILLVTDLPRHIRSSCYFLAKEKNFRSRLTRIFARHAHIVIMDINRNLVASLQEIAAILRAGKKVVIFPEGARSRDGAITPFKKTFAIIAHELGVPVVPAVIDGAFELLPINAKFPRRGTVRVEFLEPVSTDVLSEHEITEECFSRIKQSLAK